VRRTWQPENGKAQGFLDISVLQSFTAQSLATFILLAFVGLIAASIVYGEIRILTDSVWPVEDSLLQAEDTGVLTSDLIWDRKQSIIKTEFGDVLEILDPRFSFDDIGGFEYIKELFLPCSLRK
jgi:hypothetical protein